jgi:Na+:H+ antiporter, NhaA family
MSRLRQIPHRAVAALQEFLRLEAAGGILLLVAAALGMVTANSPLSRLYEGLLSVPLTVKLGGLGVDKPLLLWVNDGLMAIFFLLVALELKREILEGQFSNRSQIALPAFCALGGMALPMLIFFALNRGDSVALAGAAIPAATDIAFALGVLALLGPRVPIALKLLLMAIAVLDDLGAILIIAFFYTENLSTTALTWAFAALAGLVLLNRRNVMSPVPYALLGAVMWLAVLKSGVHATLAGVALGFTIPMRDPKNPEASPLQKLEHDLHPTVAYGILPLFAFANAGVPLAGLSLASLLEPVPLGIALGLVLGKPLGVVGFGLAAAASGLAKLPDGVGFRPLLGMGLLCGIGFTMSLFIGSLAYEAGSTDLAVVHRLGILSGSLVSALLGFAALKLWLPHGPAKA